MIGVMDGMVKWSALGLLAVVGGLSCNPTDVVITDGQACSTPEDIACSIIGGHQASNVEVVLCDSQTMKYVPGLYCPMGDTCDHITGDAAAICCRSPQGDCTNYAIEGLHCPLENDTACAAPSLVGQGYVSADTSQRVVQCHSGTWTLFADCKPQGRFCREDSGTIHCR